MQLKTAEADLSPTVKCIWCACFPAFLCPFQRIGTKYIFSHFAVTVKLQSFS